MEGKVENRVIRMHDIHDVMHRALHNYLHRLMGRMSQALKKAENVAKWKVFELESENNKDVHSTCLRIHTNSDSEYLQIWIE